MINGFAFHEIILGENGNPCDYRFLSINPAFEKLTGLKKENVIGKRVLEVLPNLEKNWIDIYGKVALTGESAKFENYAKGLNKYYSITAFSYKKGFFATIFEDITERKTIELELQEAVKSRDILLKEFQHRVKNNLLSISMLLGIDLENISKDNEARKVISNAQSRIRSISAIYDQLTYSENREKVDLNLYIKNLVNSIFDTYTIGNVFINFPKTSEAIELELKQIIPLGLILNELITNSIKYAYPINSKGEISIDIAKRDDSLTVSISDNGIGLPENFQIEETKSMGLKLVNLLTTQLGGTLTIDKKNGVKIILTFEITKK